MLPKLFKLPRAVWAWASYDWANSAYATSIYVSFFPLYLNKYWMHQEGHLSSFYLGLTHTITSLVIVGVTPILGNWADRHYKHKFCLLVFSLLGILGSAWLGYIPQHSIMLALVAFSISVIGFTLSNSFYDSLLVSVADEKTRNIASGLGYTLGYLGGGIFFGLQLWFLRNFVSGSNPTGLSHETLQQYAPFIFTLTACWWLIFSLPILLGVPHQTNTASNEYLSTYSTLYYVLQIIKNKKILFFLLGYFCYIDVVNSVMKMGFDFALASGFKIEPYHGLLAILIIQFIAVPSTIGYTYLAEIVGRKTMLIVGVVAYLLLILLSPLGKNLIFFFTMVLIIGIAQGGIQALSRSIFADMIPQEATGEYFAFYNIVGKFSSILGPFLVGIVSISFGSSFSFWGLVPLSLGGILFVSLSFKH